VTQLRIALVGLAAALLAGCGGEDRLTKPEYEQKVRSEYAKVQAAFQATAGAPTKELAARIGEAQSRLRAAAEALEGVEPPEDVEREHEELVEGMREYAEDLDGLLEGVEKGDATAIETFNESIPRNEAIERMAEAAEEMKFKGYDLGQIAEE
jgi:hypothetical protein